MVTWLALAPLGLVGLDCPGPEPDLVPEGTLDPPEGELGPEGAGPVGVPEGALAVSLPVWEALSLAVWEALSLAVWEALSLAVWEPETAVSGTDAEVS
jgi:hypothetical protein